ncbi:MAG: cytochrome c maturation protein CcmE [Cyclobacteriaceae bacterium]
MKKSHIFGIIVIAVAIMIIISSTGDASTYVNFDEALALRENGDDRQVHVVGELKKVDGKVTGLMESPDKMSFYFMMIDKNNVEQKVFHPNPIPNDLLRSEEVVIVGYYKKDTFIAKDILLKCPSKYTEEEIKV